MEASTITVPGLTRDRITALTSNGSSRCKSQQKRNSGKKKGLPPRGNQRLQEVTCFLQEKILSVVMEAVAHSASVSQAQLLFAEPLLPATGSC